MRLIGHLFRHRLRIGPLKTQRSLAKKYFASQIDTLIAVKRVVDTQLSLAL